MNRFSSIVVYSSVVCVLKRIETVLFLVSTHTLQGLFGSRTCQAEKVLSCFFFFYKVWYRLRCQELAALLCISGLDE